MVIYTLSPSRQEHCKHSYLGQSSAFHGSVTSVMTVLLPLGTPFQCKHFGVSHHARHLQGSYPIVAVTEFMYMMPVASSRFSLVNVSVVMVGSTKRLGGISSRGALMVTHGG